MSEDPFIRHKEMLPDESSRSYRHDYEGDNRGDACSASSSIRRPTLDQSAQRRRKQGSAHTLHHLYSTLGPILFAL
jgi:hypothetical protein